MPKGIPKNGINKGWFGNKPAWNKGKKGVQIGWNKGQTKETNFSVKSTSDKLTGKKLSPEHCKSISESHKGYVMNKEQRNKISQTVQKLWKDEKFIRKQKEAMNKLEVKDKCAKPHLGRKHSNDEKEKRKNSLILYYKEHPETKERTKKVGTDNGMWNNGSSYLPYSFEFNRELKENIKMMDGDKCVICLCDNKKLFIHHIDYDKMNSNENNLVALCNSCHSKTNVKREEWIKFFTTYIKENRK